MSTDVIEQLSAAGGAYISLTYLEEIVHPPTGWAKFLGRPGRVEEVERELRTRKWSKMEGIDDGWLTFAPVDFELLPGRYSAVTARRYPSDPEPLAKMAMRQPIPAAGKVRITPKILVEEAEDV